MIPMHVQPTAHVHDALMVALAIAGIIIILAVICIRGGWCALAAVVADYRINRRRK